ncbi:MAG: lysophospholipid acyltransferase family protein [Gammaproteobacteria bacterium]|nr:lysophospholipid acyltransferase family protein [Gammaproteobacteria bacterium]
MPEPPKSAPPKAAARPMRATVFSTPVVTPLLRGFSRLALALMGWKLRGGELKHKRFVLIGAPHTSNWDFPLMIMAVLALRLRVFWMGKHTLFPFPFAGLMKWLGGIPIDRSRPHNVVRETVRQYQRFDELIVLVPPEGTRSKVKRWKTGFYHIASNAGVPILLGYVDAGKKEAGFADFHHPTGDAELDMAEIRKFYEGKTGLKAANT